MSSQVATPTAVPTTTEPVVATTTPQEPVVAGEAPAAAATAAAAAEEHDSHEGPVADAPAHAKKRSPFGELKNKLFHKVSVLSRRDWAGRPFTALSRPGLCHPARAPHWFPTCLPRTLLGDE